MQDLIPVRFNTCKIGLIMTKTQCLQADALGEGDKDMVGPYMI